MTKVSVIGAGKMGLPLACALASHGADVTACDVSPDTVAKINAGACPFDEPGVSEILAEAVRAGRLRATLDTEKSVAESEVVIVIVPVLLTPQREADLAIIESIAEVIGRRLNRGAMVSFETTLPIGGTRRLGKIIEKGGLKMGEDFDLVFSPERVKSRLVMKHLYRIPKVVGGITPRAAERGAAFYGAFLGAPVANVGTLEAAELVKLSGMIYRDVNIALANELARYAEIVGVDFEPVRSAANTDGEAAVLAPGIGVGGHCTPVYPHFFINDARQRGISVELAELGRRINEVQPARMLDKLGNVAGKRAVILGLSFRPGVKEAAYSPAYALRAELENRGAVVSIHDPLYTDEELRCLGFRPGGIEGNEVVVLNTAHEEYLKLDWAALSKSGVRMLLDGRNAIRIEEVAGNGIAYFGIGVARVLDS